MCIKNVSTAVRAAISAVLLAGAALPAIVLANPADDPAVVGREGQAFGKTLSDTFQFPTEGAGGTLNLGNGESINPNDMAPGGEGLYIQAPNVGGLQGIFDSDESMHDVGRGAQNQLWQDAQQKGNPFDPDPAMRDQPGPSTVSGAVYQIITGVSDARAQVPDLTNDPIVNTAGDHILNEGLLESFGDCSVETEVTETSRPVHVPDMEYCDRVTAPAPSNCEIKHEIILDRVRTKTSVSAKGKFSAPGSGRCRGTPSMFTVTMNSDICKTATTKDVSALKISYLANYGVDWESSGECGGGTYTGTIPQILGISKPRCAADKLVVDVRHDPYGINGGDAYWVNTIDFTVSGVTEIEVVQVAKDNWYPEECVKAAQKAAE